MHDFFNIQGFIDANAVAQSLPIFVWIYIMIIVAVIVDLSTAIHYCKRAGVPIMSQKLRCTIDKLIRYFGLLFIASTIDVISFLIDLYGIFHITSLPIITGLAGICLCLIEAKSVFEHRDPDKQKLLRKTAESLIDTLSKKDAKIILDYIAESERRRESEKATKRAEK